MVRASMRVETRGREVVERDEPDEEANERERG